MIQRERAQKREKRCFESNRLKIDKATSATTETKMAKGEELKSMHSSNFRTPKNKGLAFSSLSPNLTPLPAPPSRQSSTHTPCSSPGEEEEERRR